MIIFGLIILISSFLLTFSLTPFNIKLSQKIGLIDRPKPRGIHEQEIPLSGGISIAVPVIFSSILTYIFFYKLGDVKNEINSLFLPLSLGSLGILILGILDDKHTFTASYKLIGQIIVATLMYFFHFKIVSLTNPFGLPIHLNYLSYPITLTWYLVIINAFNLIDGLDGLATGIAAIVSLLMVAIGFNSNPMVFIISLSLFGSCIAFLKYNFHPASIFLGDAGSMLLGFVIASLSIAGNTQYKGLTAITMIIPIVALFFPLTDMTMAIFRRLKNRRHIFEADKEHLHHRLLSFGFSQKVVALISYFITFLFALIAFGFNFAKEQITLIILIVLFFIMLIIFYYILKKEFFK